MSLIKTLAELKQIIPRLNNLSGLLPNVDKAGKTHIIPLIGANLYRQLDTKYNATPNEMTVKETELIKHIQLPLAAAAMIDDMPFMHTSIGDTGIKTTSTANMTPAHRWEYMELRNALSSYLADGIELLLQFLNANKGEFETWTDSEAYKDINSFLIKSGSDFKKYYPIHNPNRTFWILQSVMSDVEENYFNSALGRDLFAWVKNQEAIVIVVDGGEVDVKKVLKKAMAQFTIKHAAEQLATRFDQNGFTVLASGDKDNSEESGRAAAEKSDRIKKADAANREGQNNLAKACNYLVRIANGEFAEDFGNDFTNGFDKSPLKQDPNRRAYSNGNERRKFFRF